MTLRFNVRKLISNRYFLWLDPTYASCMTCAGIGAALCVLAAAAVYIRVVADQVVALQTSM